MKRATWSILILWLLPGTVPAETIYRLMDEQGNVTFTDEPLPGAMPVQVDPTPPMELVIPSIPERKARQQADQPESGEYSRLAIASPADGATIEARVGGVLMIELDIEPPLAASDRVTIFLDDTPVVSDTSGTRHAVSSISPGSHQIRFEIRRGDETIARSPAQAFEFAAP
ncbi:MAG: DUF4124 domain-containing protein [Halothiobacillaceae bacterium]